MNDTISYSKLKGQKLKFAFIEILKYDDWQFHVEKLLKIHGFKLTNSFFSATYHESNIISSRAIASFGLLTRIFVKTHQEKLRILMRRCIWMLTEESGGIPWKIPEIMGAIMSSDKVIAEDYINILFSYIKEVEDGPENFLEHTPLRKAVYSALLNISMNFPELIVVNKEIIEQRINSENDPEIIADLCLIIAYSGLKKYKYFIEKELLNEDVVEIYSGDKIIMKKVADIAQELLQLMTD